jgi:hypothetical protein
VITSIIPIVCGQVIISLTIDSEEKAACAARIEKICETADYSFDENETPHTGMSGDILKDVEEDIQTGTQMDAPAVNVKSMLLWRVSRLCDEAGISYTHMYIWCGDSGFAANAAGYLRYRMWARTTGSKPFVQ